jgi:hypothetical protein
VSKRGNADDLLAVDVLDHGHVVFTYAGGGPDLARPFAQGLAASQGRASRHRAAPPDCLRTVAYRHNHTHAHSTAPDDADSNALPLEGLDGRQLETIRILTAEGSSKTICFDITSFFGKP